MAFKRKLRKISKWIGVLLAVLIVIGTLSLLAVKHFVNPDLIKDKILTVLSERAGGMGDIEDIELKFFYRPHVVITGGKMSIPDKLDASFETLIVYPKLFPLLKGDVDPSYVKLVNPKVKLFLHESPGDISVPAAEPLSMEGLKAEVIKVLEFLDTNEKHSKVEIKNGQLSIVKENEDNFYLNRFNATLQYPNDRLNLYISGGSNLSERIVLNGWVNTVTYDARGSLRLFNSHPHKVLNLIDPGMNLFSDSSVDVTLGFDIKELEVFDLKLKSPKHSLTLAKGDEELRISGRDLDVDIYADQKSARVNLNKSHLLSPGLKANGSFVADNEKGEMSLSISGEDVTVVPTRKGVLIAAGDNHIVNTIFKIVKGGKVPKVTLNGKGSSLKNMFHKGNYVVKGNLVDGDIFVPGADLELTDVSGDALINHGLLNGTNLKAKMGNSSGTDGTLTVGTEGPIGPLNLEIQADADLNDITPLLKRFVKDEGFQQELAQITNINGRAQGTLIVGDKKKNPEVSFSAESYKLSADYGRVPYVVEIEGSKFDYVDKAIELGGMDVSVGKFSSNIESGSFEWQQDRILSLNTKETSFDLKEFYQWLTSHESMLKHMGPIESMSGIVRMSPLSFSGPVLSPREWTIESSGEISNATVAIKGLQELVTSTRMSFNITPQNISFPETRLDSGESSVFVNFNMWDYLSNAFGLELDFKGSMSAAASNAVSELVKVPRQIEVMGNVSISDSSVKIESIKDTENKSDHTQLTISGGPKKEYTLDISLDADSFKWAEPESGEETKSQTNVTETQESPSENDSKGSRSPIYGSVRFNSGDFHYGGFNWDSIGGDVEFQGDLIDINIKEANLCGISTPGFFEVATPALKLDFKPYSEKEDFANTIDCLFEKTGIISGDYDIDGNIFSNGKSGAVVKSLEGELNLSSNDGQVHQHGGLVKFLSVLNFGEIFRGKGPDFSEEGFPYSFLVVNSEIKEGQMNIKQAVMDGPSLKIVGTGVIDLVEKTLDLEVVVIPLLAVDSVIDKIPILSAVFGEKSSSIPIKITGSLYDPEFSQTSPHAIKSGLLTIIKQTLNLPVTLIKPVDTGLKDEKAKEEERREKVHEENGEQN